MNFFIICRFQKSLNPVSAIRNSDNFQGPRSNFEIGGGGTVSDSILGGGHKTLFLTNSL